MIFLILTFILSSILSTSITPVESAGKYQHSVVYYFEPYEDDWDKMCLANSTYPIVTFCSQKIPNLEEFLPENYTPADIGSLTHNGFIVEYAKPNYEESNATIIRITIPGFEMCVAWSPEYTQSNNPRSFRYLGNPDPELPGLSLLPMAHAQGVETYVESDIPAFDGEDRITVGFWAITGNDSWTLYSLPNFEGETACLIPDPWSYGWAFGNGDFALPDGSHQIGSVQHGCHSKNVLRTDLTQFDAVRGGSGGILSLQRIYDLNQEVIENEDAKGTGGILTTAQIQKISEGSKLVEDCLLSPKIL